MGKSEAMMSQAPEKFVCRILKPTGCNHFTIPEATV